MRSAHILLVWWDCPLTFQESGLATNAYLIGSHAAIAVGLWWLIITLRHVSEHDVNCILAELIRYTFVARLLSWNVTEWVVPTDYTYIKP